MRLHRRSVCLAALGLGACLAAAVAYGAYHRWQYPHGWSHCCETALRFALDAYADDHNGAFPSCAGPPESSLSLLYPTYAGVQLLAGKTGAVDQCQARLESDAPLLPGMSSWHYVPGLSRSDDPDFALFWDAAGLGHFGERLSAGGHVVWFVSLRSEYISGDRWDAFLERQKSLWKQKGRGGKERGATSRPPLRSQPASIWFLFYPRRWQE